SRWSAIPVTSTYTVTSKSVGQLPPPRLRGLGSRLPTDLADAVIERRADVTADPTAVFPADAAVATFPNAPFPAVNFPVATAPRVLAAATATVARISTV